MRINEDGLVGIGTNSPSDRLEVVVPGSGEGITVSGTNPILQLKETGGSLPVIRFLSAATPKWSMQTNTTFTQLIFIDQASGRQNLVLENDGDVILAGSGTGNVGVGTTSPGAKLHVSGTNNTEVRLRSTNTDSDAMLSVGNDAREWQVRVDSSDKLFVRDATAGVVRIAADLSGNVGIGTTNPAQPLHVIGKVVSDDQGTYKDASFTGSGDDSRATFAASTNWSSGGAIVHAVGNTSAWTGTRGALVLRSGNAASPSGQDNQIAFQDYSGTNLVAIQQSGNVGIGTTSPSAKLDVNGDTMRLRSARTPASASAAGNQGDSAWDSNYLYICVAANTWRRVAHSSW